jgi:hypothetical protein
VKEISIKSAEARTAILLDLLMNAIILSRPVMKVPVLILLPLPFFVWGCTAHDPDQRASALSGVSLPGLEQLHLSASRELNVHGVKVREFTGALGTAEVNVSRMENVDAQAAARILQQKRFQLESLSMEQVSPYPGEISAKVKCAQSYLPKLKDLNRDSYSGLRVEAAANARKNVGVCGDNEFSYDAVFVYLYCKKQRVLMQIESFFPKKEKPADWLSKASC